MANNRQYRRKMHQKVDSIETSFSVEFVKVVKVFIGIFIFLIFFYFLTVYLLQRDVSSGVVDTTPGEADIQYQEILAGSSFSMNASHYLVLYYDMSDESLRSSYTSLISSYEDLDNHLPIYTVDMSSTFNKKYSSDTSNSSVQDLDDLQINGPTLIEFNNDSVSDYIQGQEAISEFLS